MIHVALTYLSVDTQQTGDLETMMAQCWASVTDGGLTSNHHGGLTSNQ